MIFFATIIKLVLIFLSKIININKSDAARVLPIANNEKYFCVKEHTSIRLVGKLDATLTWIAGSKLETCNKVCITQGPASREQKINS